MQPPIFVIYKNLPAFLEARKLKTDYQFKFDAKGLDLVIDNMEKTGYMDIKAVSSTNGIVRIIVLYTHSEYSKKTPKLKSLIASIESSDDYIAGKVTEVIYIVDNEFVEKKSSLVAAIEERREAKENKNVYIRLCTYRMFVMNILLKPDTPKSRIMSKEEIDFHLKYNRKTEKDLNTIDEKIDAIVTWLGAKKGDIIEHEILSRNCGLTYKVRRVI